MMMLYYIAGAGVGPDPRQFPRQPGSGHGDQKIWAQPLLVRYIPGTVLFLLASGSSWPKAMARVTTAGIVTSGGFDRRCP